MSVSFWKGSLGVLKHGMDEFLHIYMQDCAPALIRLQFVVQVAYFHLVLKQGINIMLCISLFYSILLHLT